MSGKSTPFFFAILLGLTGCATVTDKIPTVKIERKKPKVIQTVQSNYTAPRVQRAEAEMVCENDNMRARASDNNLKNDMARVLILEEGGRSSNVIADVEVNCRDYFQTVLTRQIVPTRVTTTAQRVISPQPVIQTSYVTSHSIQVAPEKPQTQHIIMQPEIRQQAKVIKASSNVQAADGYYYSIKKGDTLYRIARENCSSVQDISMLNGIYDPTKIEVHQIIRLPSQKCNALK